MMNLERKLTVSDVYTERISTTNLPLKDAHVDAGNQNAHNSTELPQSQAVKFQPVRLSFFQKEFEEAENEPFPSFDISNIDIEDTDDVDTSVDSELSPSVSEDVTDEKLAIFCNTNNEKLLGNESSISVAEKSQTVDVADSQGNISSSCKSLPRVSKNSKLLENTSGNSESLPTIMEEQTDAISETKDLITVMEPTSSKKLGTNSRDNVDIGVNWLVTPGKQQKSTNNFFTPNVIRCDRFVTPNANRSNRRMAPNVSRVDKFTPIMSSKYRSSLSGVSEERISRIPCTVGIGSFLSTPLTKVPTAIQKSSQKVRRVTGAPIEPVNAQNAVYVPIVQVNGVLQEKRCDESNVNAKSAVTNESCEEKCDKSSANKSAPIIQDRNSNKENAKNCEKVQFSLPLNSPTLDEFKTVRVKNVNYIILNKLGVGGSSVVFNCFDPVTKSVRAIKRVSLSGDKNLLSGYVNEVKLLEKLQKCDRIIKMYSYEIFESEKLLLVVLEKGHEDLSKILKDLSRNVNRLPTYKLIYYWMEMLYAVKQIHDNDIIHSDLKPANFLQVSSGLKLIDFGIASCIQSDMTSVIKNVQVGSFNYISPEALRNDSGGVISPKYKVNYKSDVWSLGCILYQLAYRKTPFQHIGHTYAKVSAILDPNHQIEYPDVDTLPTSMINMMKACLQYNSKSRPSVDELIEQSENIYQIV